MDYINGDFLDLRTQRKALEKILSEVSRECGEKRGAFDKDKYLITCSKEGFCGRYDRENDRILLDKFFIYDAMCSGETDRIKNAIKHEEAHRQAVLSGKNSNFADHWQGWLNEYLSMGGKPPQVYLKTKLYERSADYGEVRDFEIEEIILLTDDGSRESRYLLRKREKIKKPFLLLTSEKAFSDDFDK